MARVDDDAEAVHLGDPLLAERTQPLPAPLTRRAVGELIVLRMHRPGEAQALVVEFLQQREVFAERIAGLPRLEGDELAFLVQPLCVGGGARGERTSTRLNSSH